MNHILEVFETYRAERYGYEFSVREKLSCVCLSIIKNNQEILKEQNTTNDTDSLRLKKMLTFIHTNYANSIELRDIANTAAISERESLRCFKNTIGISPIKYLLRHRVSVAADMLVSSKNSITEISNQVGFESPSYFSSMFKKLVGVKPKDYRITMKSRQKEQKSIK